MLDDDGRMFLDALGVREGDARLSAAVELVGGDYDTEIFDDPEATYLVMDDRGVDFLLEDDVVVAVFVYGPGSANGAPYARGSHVVQGLDFGASPGEARRVLGEPKRTGPTYLLYELEQRVLHLEFTSGTLTMFTLQLRDVAG
ncbi:hypothetical protein EK0264_16630 [Epidermidibacterium keratini]|uniref:Uncharacterized protein n=1 Tax=Epidermidibacterium keratini TaxID=1891644 RepID=A0A7L4YR69_9ACTN|nr:hypothetical protein [Epidermidibacterium keratini]QHC01745.1 hypothetical protein EK0264_16630 [Epidermidibacterium keratini]